MLLGRTAGIVCVCVFFWRSDAFGPLEKKTVVVTKIVGKIHYRSRVRYTWFNFIYPCVRQLLFALQHSHNWQGVLGFHPREPKMEKIYLQMFLHMFLCTWKIIQLSD